MGHFENFREDSVRTTVVYEKDNAFCKVVPRERESSYKSIQNYFMLHIQYAEEKIVLKFEFNTGTIDL